MVQQKINAFRDFASQLAAQVTEQLCTEFEREMGAMWNDVLMYRNELDRVAQLLGTQLEREKKLHGVIEQMVGHSANVHQHAQMLAQQKPGSNELHGWLEQVLGQHADLLNQTVAGVGQTSQILQNHAMNAQQMKQETISTENEFMRIIELLRQPPISGAAPAPTVAVVPQGASVRYSPGNQGSPPPPGASGFSTPPPSQGQLGAGGMPPMMAGGIRQNAPPFFQMQQQQRPPMGMGPGPMQGMGGMR